MKHINPTDWSPVLCTACLTLALLLFPKPSLAHRPLFAGDAAGQPQSAVRIYDPTVSHVLYMELSSKQPRKWFTFETDGPLEIPVKVGIPQGLAHNALQPVVVFLGPGAPESDEELSALLSQERETGFVRLETVQSIQSFYEPVTGTTSLIVIEDRVRLAEAGVYYGIVFEEEGRAGKVWVSIGQSEGFTWRDVPRLPAWIRQVRRFHGIPGWPRWAWIGVLLFLAIALGAGAWVRIRRGSLLADE